MTPEEETRWQEGAERSVRAAIDEAERTPPPSPESVTEDVYASRPYGPTTPGG